MRGFIVALICAFITINTQAQIKSAALTASGLTCSMCSKSIYKALTRLSYVASVDVDIEKSAYNIIFKKDAKVDIDGLKKAVEGAGFAVAELKVTADVQNVEVYNDAHVIIANQNFHFVNVEKRQLAGETTFRIVDKKYLPDAEYSKYKGMTTMKCIETGYMGGCCPKDKSPKTRIYHATL